MKLNDPFCMIIVLLELSYVENEANTIFILLTTDILLNNFNHGPNTSEAREAKK